MTTAASGSGGGVGGPTLVGVACEPALRGAPHPYADRGVVRQMVLDSLLRAGLLAPGETSLAGLVRTGSRVLVKPNWVSETNESGGGTDCLWTHSAILEAVVELVAACRPARIVVADAPILGCQFDQVVDGPAKDGLRRAAGDVPLEIADLRRVVLVRVPGGREPRPTARQDGDYATFDLGSRSALEPISRPPGRFRVTWYDPRRLAAAHAPGRHQYVLAREPFDADVIVNLPKLKTHRKTGMTGALKNLVGLNGNKDFLPHHRVGGTWTGGDCYAGFDPVRRFAEFCLDRSNMARSPRAAAAWRLRAERLLGAAGRRGWPTDVEGGWWGNDTCWRMVLDLNRLLLFGDADGAVAASRRRRAVTIVDAIVAGEGEGPLAPSPLTLGCVLAGTDGAAVDCAAAGLLGFAPERLALLRGAFASASPAIAEGSIEDVRAVWRGGTGSVADLRRALGLRARAAAGWKGRVEASP